ncbi:MAG: hypothetical protein M0020_10720 [Actinomycetota bacterium]|jgi:uncharacterized protein YicC (UPF0701 family)|nr:hypothetical protein [Actinomycetota bacterium]
MSSHHKAAMAEGRQQSRVVRRYLEALEESKPKRGRKRTPESVRRELAAVKAKLDEANSLDRLLLTQQRKDLEAELERSVPAADISALEQEFVKLAKPYGERRGLDYGTWREVGVPATVLERAGIPRTRRTS